MVRKIRSIKQARKAKWAAAESRTRGSAPRGQIRQGSCWALLGNRTASQKSAECRFEVHTLTQPPKASVPLRPRRGGRMTRANLWTGSAWLNVMPWLVIGPLRANAQG